MRSEDETPPLDTLEAAKAAEPRPRSGLLLIPWFALLIVLLIGVPLATYYITKANGERDSAIAQRDVYAKQAEQLKEQVKALGGQPVVTPSPIPSSGPTAKALTGDEVRAVVTDELGRYKLTITPSEVNQISRTAAALVPRPKDGETPTPAELQTYAKIAIASYCLEGRCDGKPGTAGPQGEQGPAGKDAPKVTDAELLAAAQTALAAYCAQDNKPCTPKDGVDGKDAPPPYSVVDMDCVGDGLDSYWKTYLSNGTDQRVITALGPCRIGPDPN